MWPALQTSMRAPQPSAACAAARSSLQLLLPQLLTGMKPAEMTAVSPVLQGAGASHEPARDAPERSSCNGQQGRVWAFRILLSRRTCRPRAAGMLTVPALAPGMGTNRQLTQAGAAAGHPRGPRVPEILVLPAGGGLSRQQTCAGVDAAAVGARALWVLSPCRLLGLADRVGALAAEGDAAGAAPWACRGTLGIQSAPCQMQRDLDRCAAGMQCWAARSHCSK